MQAPTCLLKINVYKPVRISQCVRLNNPACILKSSKKTFALDASCVYFQPPKSRAFAPNVYKQDALQLLPDEIILHLRLLLSREPF